MFKKPSFLWSLAVGAIFTVLQTLIYLLRFSAINANAPIIDYIAFFIGGSLIGLGLIYFVRRSETTGVYRATIIGFVIGVPFALMGMMLGGLIGPVGSILFSMSPGIFTTALGHFLGRIFSKKPSELTDKKPAP